MIAKPDAFKTLLHPNCSHCLVEANRRKEELRADDRVLCWMQVQTDGYINDGAIPIRFFLNTYRVLSDSWGVFVYDPDAGYARGFSPEGGPFRFHGWRNGVMVMKGKDGTLYSCLTGIAFEGPRKGKRLEPRPTLVSDWGFWQKRYPQAVAFTMDDKYKPIDLPTEVNEDSRKSRLPADKRLPADTMVLGVWDGHRARAYPLDVLERAGVLHDMAHDQPRLVLWYAPTRTAAAYRQPFGTSGLKGDAGWIFSVDPQGGGGAVRRQENRLALGPHRSTGRRWAEARLAGQRPGQMVRVGSGVSGDVDLWQVMQLRRVPRRTQCRHGGATQQFLGSLGSHLAALPSSPTSPDVGRSKSGSAARGGGFGRAR